jgi:signal transduction histidine kinase
MDIAIAVIIAVAAAAVGLFVGRSGEKTTGREEGREEGRAEAQERLRTLAKQLSRGRIPQAPKDGTPESDLLEALERGWGPREAEREQALREAIGRVSTFLDQSVRAPLTGFDHNANAGELRERIERALGALQDLDFFIAEPGEVKEGTDLSALAQKVSREFAADQNVGVRLRLGGAGIRAVVNPSALMDALYLVLHNAARFGGGSTVDLTVASENGRATVVVRDRGKGFSEEAFKRAFDPFYSTSPDGLGLGLPHARRTLESMGGKIEIRNVPDGGAEVEISLPTA